MLLDLSLVYGAMVFIAGVGVLQATAAYNNILGLSFFPKKTISYLFAAVTIGFALGMLFDWNWHYATGIIQGAQQAELFLIAMVAALLFTALVASLINIRRFSKTNESPEGLDALRNETLVQNLKRHFGKRV